MKSKFLLPFLTLIFGSTIGCSNSVNPIKLSYGSYIDEEAKSISYEQLKMRVESGENMLVASYYKNIDACECQKDFYNLIKDYMSENHYLFYSFDCGEMEDSKDDYGFVNLEVSAPSLYIINKGKVFKKYSYTQKAYEKVFKDYSFLTKEINKYCRKPSLFYVNEDVINSNLKTKDKIGIAYVRSSCPDCTYFLPNFLIPFTEAVDLNVETWIYDIDYCYSDKEAYQKLKDSHQLSEEANGVLGYGNGVVPTIQYYENGILISACVYFNDTIAFDSEQNSYVISDTYYTESRVVNLPYLDYSDILLHKKINEDEISSSRWINECAAKVHNPIIEKFYRYYFL